MQTRRVKVIVTYSFNDIRRWLLGNDGYVGVTYRNGENVEWYKRYSVGSKNSNEGVKATAAYISATARRDWHKIVPSRIVRKSWMWIDPVHMSSVMRRTRRIQCPHVPRMLLRRIRLSLAFYRSGTCPTIRNQPSTIAFIKRSSI